MKLPTTKLAICPRVLEYTILHQLKKEELKLYLKFWFYFMGEHKNVIYITVVHVYIFQLPTETALPEALYRVWICAVGSCRCCISRTTRGAQVELDWCKLCVCVCLCVCGGGS